VPALQYAPDEGPLALRQALAAFLTAFYARSVSVERICSTGGASQNLGVALAAFTDPVYTRAVWAVEPTYYLACRLFDDAGIKVRGVPDGATGVDIQELRKRMAEAEKEADGIDRPVSLEYSRCSFA
jgi:DNA-binding transcriptional MocR family regulator